MDNNKEYEVKKILNRRTVDEEVCVFVFLFIFLLKYFN